MFVVPRGGVEKERFQLSASTHSGAGEKKTLNINVVGTKTCVVTRFVIFVDTNDQNKIVCIVCTVCQPKVRKILNAKFTTYTKSISK